MVVNYSESGSIEYNDTAPLPTTNKVLACFVSTKHGIVFRPIFFKLFFQDRTFYYLLTYFREDLLTRNIVSMFI